MVSQSGSVEITFMGKSDVTVVLKTITDNLLKEGKPQI